MKKTGYDWRAPPEKTGPNDARRRFVQQAAALGALAAIGAVAGPVFAEDQALRQTDLKGKKPMFAYVGSRTTRERNAHGEGISVYQVDTETGALELVQLVKDLVNPSFLALSRNGERLYTVHGDASDISAFKVDKASGKLTFLNRQSTQGKNPVHLAIDPLGRYIVVSNHIGASLAVLPIAADGSLQELTQLVHLEGPVGPHRVEQKQAKPHFNPFDPTGEFVIVPDKGLDRVFTFRFKDGQLTPATPGFVVSRETAGPRHVAFHPKGAYAYVVNELDSTVTTYRYSSGNGALTPVQIVSSLPDTYTGNSRASEIEVDPSGRFVYASNRGFDSIAVFRIDQATGHLTFIDAEPTLGRTPRFMTGTPDGRFMYALNEDSDTIVAFAVNAATGQLKPTGFSVDSGSPVCMVFSPQHA
ncbi:lactonase family protein [Paraburkholderia phymatum]|uniref:6-phosphogluconolactonase n=1 Tax=Paraburkholderia phymatum (strain DSM 17167 / CIP 108236 / LMG 21445 / STM815) TaxID=391038 RepID=B2JTI5_PARP8|nr:6-phosphogluconolactonase [Paraburkholderia phymatum STM815]